MKRFGEFSLCFVPFFVAEAIQIIAAIGYGFLYVMMGILFYLMGIYKGNDMTLASVMGEFMESIGEVGNANYLISVMAVATCGIVFIFWYRKLTRREYKAKLSESIGLLDGMMIALLGIGCQLFITGGMGLIQPFFLKVFEDYAGNMNQLMDADPRLVILLVVLVAPITEELIFRGVMMHKLEKQISFLGANLLQALVFGIYHMNVVQGIYAFLLGMVLGYVTKKYNSIVVSIILHSIINGLAFVVAFFGASTKVYIIFSLIGILFLAGSIYGIQNKDRGSIVE